MLDIITTIIIALIPILGIYIAYLLNKGFKLREQINIDKRKVYLSFIGILKKSLMSVKRKEPLDQDMINESMTDFIFSSIFWAPENVLRAIGEFQKIGREAEVLSNEVKKNPYKIFEKNFGVILAMREDLGLSNKGLDWKILTQMLLKDDLNQLLLQKSEE